MLSWTRQRIAPGDYIVSTTISSLQLRSLALQGFGVIDLAGELGWNKSTVSEIRDGTRPRTFFSRALALDELYLRLHLQSNEAQGAGMVRSRALSNGWGGAREQLEFALALDLANR